MGLIVMKNRFVYKIGGVNSIKKIEMLDLHKRKEWVVINVLTPNPCEPGNTNFALNRCQLYPFNKEQILILGCHSSLSKPSLIYNITTNEYT